MLLEQVMKLRIQFPSHGNHAQIFILFSSPPVIVVQLKCDTHEVKKDPGFLLRT